jgi:hypothetical protein
LALSVGDWVEVRSSSEILATLDAQGRLDTLPFMPEMFEYCGKRFQVWKRAHKTCDTVNRTGGRRVEDAVHLQELRCNGAAHGGCDAGCLIFWKAAWLKPVSGPAGPEDTDSRRRAGADARAGCTEAQVMRATRTDDRTSDATAIYSCQATLLPQFTRPLKWWDFRQYLEDCSSGNVSLGQLLAGGLYVFYHWLVHWTDRYSPRLSRALIERYDRFQAKRGGSPYPRRRGTLRVGEKTPARNLDLQPGDLVRVLPLATILDTLDGHNKNRGMMFDAEEVPFCGKTFRVRSLCRRIIDERSGAMITMKGNNVLLDDVWCQARYSDRRMMCPRAIYPIWRETWLERVAATPAALPPAAALPSATPRDHHELAP